jgi:hypothetical protein
MPFGKTFDSQQTLRLKIVPNGRTTDPRLDKLTIFFLCDKDECKGMRDFPRRPTLDPGSFRIFT